MKVDLFLTQVPLDKAELEGKTVAVVDVLRFATSVCASLQAGARGVIPTVGPGEAGDMRSKLGPENVVLAGERKGVKIENFDFGNSPREFTPETVKNKFVVMTTTNGTGAIRGAAKARHIICTGLVNIAAVAEAVVDYGEDLVIVCSGREGHFSIEDTICGGLLLHLLTTAHKQEIDFNDAASLAMLLYRSNKSAIKQAIAQGEHGRFLASIGFEGDVEVATQVDTMPVVPILRDGRLVSNNQE